MKTLLEEPGTPVDASLTSIVRGMELKALFVDGSMLEWLQANGMTELDLYVDIAVVAEASTAMAQHLAELGALTDASCAAWRSDVNWKLGTRMAELFRSGDLSVIYCSEVMLELGELAVAFVGAHGTPCMEAADAIEEWTGYKVEPSPLTDPLGTLLAGPLPGTSPRVWH